MTDHIPHEHPEWLRIHADMLAAVVVVPGGVLAGYGAVADQMRMAADQMDADAAEITRLRAANEQLRRMNDE
jgi:hypothetical protein